MMVSSTRCWKSAAVDPPRPMRPTMLLRLALAVLLFWAPLSQANTISARSAELRLEEDHYVLNAEFDLVLNATLEEALVRGVPLYFVVEFELTRGRWYWFDQVIARATRERRIGFAPLTEQYRVSVAGVSQNVASFDEVKRILSRVRSWTVLEKGRLKPGEKYEAAVRFRLDTSQLPKPFQLNVLASREWSLSSDWYRWTINGDGKP